MIHTAKIDQDYSENEEKIIKSFRDNTFWLIEKLPEAIKKFSMMICKICGGKQENFNKPNFDDEYVCICSDGYSIAKSNFKKDQLTFLRIIVVGQQKKILTYYPSLCYRQ